MDSPGRILIVDDEALNRELLGALIEMCGHRSEEAADGYQALEKMDTEVDLVLLDIMMPGLNGIEVLKRLKDDSALRHIPVVMISAVNEIEVTAECIRLGADDYLTKPFNRTLLEARMNACLEKKRLLDRERLYLERIEEEKQRSDDLLHVILPDEIVTELKANNHVVPQLHDNVAVLFCDIVGFTAYCSTRRPDQVMPPLQELIMVYEDMTLRYNMQKIKTIGDCFMAVAGLLRPVDNPSLSCVRCGLEMVAAVRDLPVGWEVRVGIHTGTVMAGVVGCRQYLFDLWGDTVNTASRVETCGATSSVNVSAAVWHQVAGSCHGESLGLVSLKGKGDLEIFRVTGLRP